MTHSAKSSTGAAAPASQVVHEIDDAYCKGCGLCVAFCERDCLEIASEPNRRGVYIALFVAGAHCRGCCRCATVCPEGAIRIVRP